MNPRPIDPGTLNKAAGVLENITKHLKSLRFWFVQSNDSGSIEVGVTGLDQVYNGMLVLGPENIRFYGGSSVNDDNEVYWRDEAVFEYGHLHEAFLMSYLRRTLDN